MAQGGIGANLQGMSYGTNRVQTGTNSRCTQCDSKSKGADGMESNTRKRVERFVTENVIWVRFPLPRRINDGGSLAAEGRQGQPVPDPTLDTLGLFRDAHTSEGTVRA